MEEPPRFELGNGGFADHCLTTWLWLLTAHAMYQTSAARSTRPRHRGVRPSAVRPVPWGRSSTTARHCRRILQRQRPEHGTSPLPPALPPPKSRLTAAAERRPAVT